jgi:hypothetical protein
MLLALLGIAIAQDLSWECLPIAVPADARPYGLFTLDDDHGALDAAEAAWLTALAWSDELIAA